MHTDVPHDVLQPVCHNNTCPDKSPVPKSRCSRCRIVRYCSVKCQRLDWEAGHRNECAFLGEDVVPLAAKTRFCATPADWSILNVEQARPEHVGTLCGSQIVITFFESIDEAIRLFTEAGPAKMDCKTFTLAVWHLLAKRDGVNYPSRHTCFALGAPVDNFYEYTTARQTPSSEWDIGYLGVVPEHRELVAAAVGARVERSLGNYVLRNKRTRFMLGIDDEECVPARLYYMPFGYWRIVLERRLARISSATLAGLVSFGICTGRPD